jgi:EmrB/QacA subfamily drug resistance transporter
MRRPLGICHPVAVKRSTMVLSLVCVGTFLTAFDVTIVNVAYRTIGESLGNSEHLPWIISGYNIAFAAALLTAGRMADSFGRKRAFLTGISVFSASSMLCGLAPNVAWLIGARLAQAVGAALIVPSAIALVLPEFPVERRSATLGITAAVGGFGAASGPIFGGLVVDFVGWRWIFFVNVPICIAGIVAGQRLLTESRDRLAPGKRPDLLGAAIAFASVALITLALVESNRWGLRSMRFAGACTLATIAAIVFVGRTSTHPVPTLDLALLRLRFVVAANVAGVAYAMGFYSSNFLVIQWLRDVWRYSPSRAGIAAVATPLLSTSISPFAARAAQRLGHQRVALVGLSIYAAGCVLLAQGLHGGHANFWTIMVPGTALLGVGIGGSISVLSSAASAFLPAGRLAMGSALYATGRQVGGALGIAAVDAIVGAVPGVSGYRWGFRFTAMAMVVAAVAMGLLFRRPTIEELAAAEMTTVVA